MKLLFHNLTSKISSVQPLKFANGYVILSHTLLGMWSLTHVVNWPQMTSFETVVDILRDLAENRELICGNEAMYQWPILLSICDLITKNHWKMSVFLNKLMRSQICACHASWAVLTCTKLWSEWIMMCQTVSKGILCFYKIWIMSSTIRCVMVISYMSMGWSGSGRLEYKRAVSQFNPSGEEYQCACTVGVSFKWTPLQAQFVQNLFLPSLFSTKM